MQTSINPYQPVEITPENLSDDATSEAMFVLTAANLREAEEQYLLRRHMFRLSVASLAMIFASLFAIGWATTQGRFAFVMTMLISMAASAVFYLALIHRSKVTVRRKIPEIGMFAGAECSVRTTPSEFMFTSRIGTHRWDNQSLKVYFTSRGLLILPDPSTYVFVPAGGQFRDESYKHFGKRVTSRSSR